jgi:hypothetical protein
LVELSGSAPRWQQLRLEIDSDAGRLKRLGGLR